MKVSARAETFWHGPDSAGLADRRVSLLNAVHSQAHSAKRLKKKRFFNVWSIVLAKATPPMKSQEPLNMTGSLPEDQKRTKRRLNGSGLEALNPVEVVVQREIAVQSLAEVTRTCQP